MLPLPAEVENGLYRIVQESLSNVRKHARADQVEVLLAFQKDTVQVRVRDNGIGFDPAAPRQSEAGGGFGLVGLQERARLLGGNLRVESAPGRGTMIEVRVPVSSSAER